MRGRLALRRWYTRWVNQETAWLIPTISGGLTGSCKHLQNEGDRI
jgi:hypothetical protein